MAKEKYIYNTNLAKGTGFIDETLTLLELYEANESKSDFLSKCLQFNPLNKSTEKRKKDLITLVFFDRYWRDNNVLLYLKKIRENYASLSVMNKIFLVYTSRANLILANSIGELLLEKKMAQITNIETSVFINDSISLGKAPVWSEKMKQRVASYIISCLRDFELINIKGERKDFFPESFVINYFLHEMHFNGFSDNQLLMDQTWPILQLSEFDLLREIEKISIQGTFIAQYSGEILDISWNYKNMEEFIESETG